MRPAVIAILLVRLAVLQAQEPVPALPPSAPAFDVWLSELRAEATTRGISAAIIEKTLTGVEPVAQILERDQAQAEFVLDLDAYLKRRLTRATVKTAQNRRTRYATLLKNISAKYGVPPHVLVAVWGLESSFGQFAGVRPTVPTLVTLAYDPRRGPMFRNELFNALQILDRGDIPLEQLKGSWAGALGQPQFMPSNYLLYAQDFDGDGRRDIWESQPDVFASIAYFLQEHGWKKGRTWGREVTLTAAARKAIDELPRRAEGCRAVRVMTEPHPLSYWRRIGVRTTGNQPLTAGAAPASIVEMGKRTFLTYPNYDALLGYNCSHNYALSVALLSDKLK